MSVTIKIMSEIVLTDDQKNAIYKAVLVLSEPNSLFQISGPGGSGKTTIAKRIANALYEKNKIVKVIYCAPTHKACKVLRETTGKPTQTIQSFLNMEIDYDETGKTIYVLGEPEIETKHEESKYGMSQKEVFSKTLLLIDEISMVSADVRDVIRQYQKLFRFRLITLGDSAQLPPVNQNEPAFYSSFPIDVQFTENMRNSDIAYNKLLTRIRNMILEGVIQIEPFDVFKMLRSAERAHVIDLCPHILKGSTKHKEIKTKSLVRAIRMIDYTQDMLLAYRTTSQTSKTVSKLNKRSRRRLYGKQSQEYMVGERLIMTGYISYCITHNQYSHICQDESSKTTGTCDNICRLNKCDELTVTKVTKYRHPFYDEVFNVWCLSVQTDTRHNIPIYRVVREEQSKFNDYKTHVWKQCKDTCVTLNRDRRKELWNQYYKTKNTIHAPINYSYAMSVHMSQGSTTNNVYLYLTDFLWLLYNKTPENTTLFLKLLYTGLSRAKSKAVVF